MRQNKKEIPTGNMKEEVIIRTEKLCYSYEESEQAGGSDAPRALIDVDLTVHAGEYVAILGHNGSGKSTLAKLLDMILVPTSGKIELFGTDITAPDFDEDGVFDLRRHVGMVFQNPDNQLVATVVIEDVAFGPENLALPREEIRRRVIDALHTVGMEDYMYHAPHKLSGGQKQRVAIAGILAMRPRLIIFDEATAMLDPVGRRQIVDLMEKLNREEGIAVLNITHYMQEAARADRVIVINDGRIAMDDAPRAIFSEVAKLREMGLETPQGTELLHGLKEKGFSVPTDRLTVDECVEAIAEWFEG